MGYIYKATCKTTNNIYIGKTMTSVEQRWKEHCLASALPSHGDYNFPFHRAIRKYGTDDFVIETIDTGSTDDQLNEKEKYWIAYYDSYYNGYNATLCGDGQCKYDYDSIVNFYLSHNFSLLETCQHFNIYDQVVYAALKAKNIDYKQLIATSDKKVYGKRILLIEKNIIFNKMSDIDKYFNKQVHGNIRRCLNGTTEKAYGYHWRMLREDEQINGATIYNK